MNPNPGEDLEAFKERINKQELKRARSMASGFGVFAIVTLISVVYASFTVSAANSARLQAEQNAIEYQKRAEAAEQEVKQLLVQALKTSEEARKKIEEESKTTTKRK